MYKRRKILSDSDDSKDSDSEAEASTAKRFKKSSPPPQHSSSKSFHNQNSSDSDTSDDDVEWTVGNKKKKVISKKQKSRITKSHLSKDKVISGTSSDSDDSEMDTQSVNRRQKLSRSPEEGELSSSSDDAVDDKDDERSASDNDLDFDEEELKKEFDDGYDNELVGDEEDRQRLENMTEKEREQELYNRLEKREALEKRFEIEKKLRLAKIKEREEKHQKKKKKFPSYEKSISPPTGKAASRNERRRKMEEKKEKKTLEDLKAERERKKNKLTVEHKKRQILKVNEIYTDDEGDEDEKDIHMSKSRMEGRVSESDSSDVSDSDNSSSHSDSSDEQGTVPIKNSRIDSKDQLSKIRLSRDELGKWVHHPAFKSIVVGCYVRVGIGNNDDKPIYRIAEIVDICETGKIYSINNAKTNVGLRLRHGQQEKVFRIAFVSNSNFSDSEFFKWKQAVMLAGMQLPSQEDIKKKLSIVQKQKAQKLQEADIDHIVKQKQKFRKNPFNFAMKKTNLLKVKEMAETNGDTAELTRVTTQLAELEERAEKLDKTRQEGIAGITYINDQIKSYNLVKEKAAMGEYQARQKNVADPFTRRRCKPVIVSNTADGLQTQRLIQEMEIRYGGAGSKDAEAKKKEEVADTARAELAEKTKELAHDLFHAHDFDIKLDLQVPTSAEPAFVAPKVSVTNNNNNDSVPRRSLNLSDYKKRRGFI